MKNRLPKPPVNAKSLPIYFFSLKITEMEMNATAIRPLLNDKSKISIISIPQKPLIKIK